MSTGLSPTFLPGLLLAFLGVVRWIRYLRGYRKRVQMARDAGNDLAVFSEQLTVVGVTFALASLLALTVIWLARSPMVYFWWAFRAAVASIVIIVVSWFLSGWSGASDPFH